LLPVKIERDISILKDLVSLWVTLKHYRRIKPDIVNVGTPKMGLLGILAAAILGIKKRIYTCRGFRYEHEKGFKRKILMFMERLTGIFAHEIICISPSVKELGVKDKIFKPEKCRVIHKGSSNGINLEKYNPKAIILSEKEALIQKFNLKGKFVYGFIGRVTEQKGINELFEAFKYLSKNQSNISLLFVGTVEKNHQATRFIVNKIEENSSCYIVGSQNNVPLHLSLMDILVLPSWREGFGNVLVEAAAMGIPVISTQGTGTRDAVSDGFNGILVDVKNIDQLKDAMLELKNNPEKRITMGKNGIEWAKNFDRIRIWEGMKELYMK
jgi:glycosyltransferase involved in cell wall biosynthesis